MPMVHNLCIGDIHSMKSEVSKDKKRKKINRHQIGYQSGHCGVSFDGAKGFRTEGLLVLVSVADCVKCVLPYGNGAGYSRVFPKVTLKDFPDH